jgi:hypothetical protein
MSDHQRAKPGAEMISRFKKERYLLTLSEDDFRDLVVRPLFLRLGLRDGRDLCGPTEAGKDAVFVNTDPLGLTEILVVQTKKGTLNESRSKKQNVIEAITQLKTASATSVMLLATKSKHIPSKVYLCASGEINDAAKHHIIDEVKDPRLVFLDKNDLIPLIDEHCSELWLSLEAELFPYFRALIQHVDSSSEAFSIDEGATGDSVKTAATDNAFVPLKVFRVTTRPKKVRNVVEQVPHIEELPVTGLPMRKERTALILGEAGAGKSTSLRRIAYTLAKRGLEVENDYRVPVVLRAVDIARRIKGSLVEAAADETKRISNSSKAAFSGKDLAEGRLLLLVDALDEVTDDDGRLKVIELIHELQASYPRCQVIATSREYGFVQSMKGLTGFAQFRVMPIDFKQAEQILERLSRKTQLPQENARELLRRLQQVHGMELNPLLVTVFAATSDYARKDIPANITELFKKFTEMMLGRWDQSKGLGQQYHAPLKDFVLRRVAFEMHRNNVTSVDVAEFQKAVESELQKRGHRANARELLDEILHRSGLFRITGNSVEFRHLLLQEFFAGRGIPSDDLLDAIIGDEWWQRAIVFYFGEHPDNAAGITKLATALKTRPAREVFPASIALGLALQACYLVEVPHKITTFVDVVGGLAASRNEFLKAGPQAATYPLSHFLGYYLFGREAVACDLTHDHFDGIWARLNDDELFSGDEQELRMFWLIVGLIEAGHMDRAEKLIRSFKPEDNRLQLALFAGCFLMKHTRVVSKDQEKGADKAIEHLAQRIPHLRKQLIDEIHSELLEIREGRVTTIELPSSNSERRALPAPAVGGNEDQSECT